MEFQLSISKEEVALLPVHSFKKEIYVIENEDQLSAVEEKMRCYKLYGFDTETKPNFKKGSSNKVALLQLANDEVAFLIRINKLGFPDVVKDILESSKVHKIGLALSQDISTLRTYRQFNPKQFIDLQNYVKEFGIENFGLRKLAALILNFRISKAQQVSNWENPLLTPAQILYAATDAWVCYEIYTHLKRLQ